MSNRQNIPCSCTVSLRKPLSAGDYAIWHNCRRIIRQGQMQVKCPDVFCSRKRISVKVTLYYKNTAFT